MTRASPPCLNSKTLEIVILHHLQHAQLEQALALLTRFPSAPPTPLSLDRLAQKCCAEPHAAAHFEKSPLLLRQLLEAGHPPSPLTVDVFMRAAMAQWRGAAHHALALISLLRQHGCPGDLVSRAVLRQQAFARAPAPVARLQALFDAIEAPSASDYYVFIDACLFHGALPDALRLLEEAESRFSSALSPSVYVPLFRSAQLGTPQLEALMQQMRGLKIQPHRRVWASFLAAVCRDGDFDRAQSMLAIFERHGVPAGVDLYAPFVEHLPRFHNACDVLQLALDKRLKPNPGVLNVLIARALQEDAPEALSRALQLVEGAARQFNVLPGQVQHGELVGRLLAAGQEAPAQHHVQTLLDNPALRIKTPCFFPLYQWLSSHTATLTPEQKELKHLLHSRLNSSMN